MYGNVDLNKFNKEVARPAAFAGGTTNARGDDGGTSDPKTLFTVTGDVLVRIFGVVTVDLVSAGAGTVSVGVTGNTAGLLALETGTDLDANGVYVSATQVAGTVAFSSVPGPFVIVNGLDINEYIGTADVTAGNIYYICLWQALSEDGNVVAAGATGF
jgi:hypothetical protein